MKRFIPALCFLVLVSPVLRAQTLSPEDRAKALKYLEKTRDGVFAATKGLSEAQWNFKPGPDRWSVAEVTEHIAAAEDFIRGNVEQNVMKAPPRTGSEDIKAIDEFVLNAVPDRSHK